MKIEIETKYNIGDTVVVMGSDLKVTECKITEVIVYVTGTYTSIRYFVEFGDCTTNSYGEENIYPNRQAIIDIINNGGKA